MTTSLLADDFFRLCHHDASGRLLLGSGAAATGLGAALLAEVALDRRITIEDGRVRVVSATAPADALAHKVLDHIAGESQVLPIRTWLAFLSSFAYDEVAQRLIRAHHVRPEQGRVLFRRNVVYVPTDINVAAWPAARLSLELRRLEPLGAEDLLLAGLAEATDLHRYLLDGAPRASFEHLADLIASSWPGVQELLHHTKAAVGDGVLSAH